MKLANSSPVNRRRPIYCGSREPVRPGPITSQLLQHVLSYLEHLSLWQPHHFSRARFAGSSPATSALSQQRTSRMIDWCVHALMHAPASRSLHAPFISSHLNWTGLDCETWRIHLSSVEMRYERSLWVISDYDVIDSSRAAVRPHATQLNCSRFT